MRYLAFVLLPLSGNAFAHMGVHREGDILTRMLHFTSEQAIVMTMGSALFLAGAVGVYFMLKELRKGKASAKSPR